VSDWMKELLQNSQPILIVLQKKIAALTVQLQSAASPDQPRGLGKMTSVVIDREIGDWKRFNNRRQIASYTGLCPGEYSSGNTRLQSCVTKHGNPRLRAALVELAWRLVRFQPNYKPVRKWRQILAKGALATGAARNKAIGGGDRVYPSVSRDRRTCRLAFEAAATHFVKAGGAC